jgi:hypothetical protein
MRSLPSHRPGSRSIIAALAREVLLASASRCATTNGAPYLASISDLTSGPASSDYWAEDGVIDVIAPVSTWPPSARRASDLQVSKARHSAELELSRRHAARSSTTGCSQPMIGRNTTPSM